MHSQNKQYEIYLEKIRKKGQKTLVQFQNYLQTQLSTNPDNIPRIIDYFIFTSNLPTLNLQDKTIVIQILERICYAINNDSEVKDYLSQLVGSILKFFNDPLDKIRFAAISSIYNIFKFLDDNCLAVFTRTFKQLPCIITDPSADVRQAAAHLNHTMKTLLNNAILDHYDFDYEDFVNILTQNFLHSHPVIKSFLIDWINTIDQIKQFQSTKYLPLFLKKLFLFLVDENKHVRIKAEECLNGFIEAFNLSFTCSKQQITKRYKEQETQSILILLIKIIEESIVFQSSSEIDIHVFTWLDNFCDFLLQEINHGLEPFLSKIFINIFQPLFDVLMKALSIQPENIQKKIAHIHQNLLKVYPFLYSQQPEIQKAANFLQLSLSNCESITKTQIVIKWVNRMAENNNEDVHAKISKFIDFLVEKACQFNTKNLISLFDLLQGSIFITQYFSAVIHALLLQLQRKKTPNQTGILSHIVSLSNSDYNFILLCSQIIQLPQQKYAKFKIRLAETLLGFLITQKSLKDFQQNIRKRKINNNIFRTLALSLLESRAAYTVLSLLIRDYKTACMILDHMGQESINTGFMHSLFKVSNLLMHPSMHHIFLDMGSTSQVSTNSRRAYLSLLMFLPINRITFPLIEKVKQLTTEQDQIGFIHLRQRQKQENSQMFEIYWQRYGEKGVRRAMSLQ